MVDQHEPMETVKRGRDTAAWAFRSAMGLVLGLVAWIGLEIKADTKATNDKLAKIATDVAVTARDVGRHDSDIELIKRDLRALELRGRP